MYLSYEQYKLFGGAVDLADYPRMAAFADIAMDHWTLGRIGRAFRDGDELPECVMAAYAATVDAMPDALESMRGERLKAFSNGVDSYTFADPSIAGELADSVGWVVRMLPVEWVSACVSYEGGCHEG